MKIQPGHDLTGQLVHTKVLSDVVVDFVGLFELFDFSGRRRLSFGNSVDEEVHDVPIGTGSQHFRKLESVHFGFRAKIKRDDDRTGTGPLNDLQGLVDMTYSNYARPLPKLRFEGVARLTMRLEENDS